MGRENVLIVRGRDRKLRAFLNVCRHRGARVCMEKSGTGQRKLQCGYHAWTYALDGSLVAAPNLTQMEDVDRTQYGLIPVHLREWLGYVWVCLADEPPSFEDTVTGAVAGRLGDDDIIERLEDRPARGRPAHHLRREGQLEAHHRELHGVLPLRHDPPRAHRGAAGVRRRATPRSTSSATAPSSVRTSSGFTVDGTAGVDAIPGVAAEHDRKYYAITVNPQVFINLVPDHVIFHRMYPVAADRTIVDCDWLYLPEVVASGKDLSRSVELFHRVNEQDFDAAERCQLAANSRAYANGGVLVPSEHHIGLFHEWVSQHLDAGAGTRRPAESSKQCARRPGPDANPPRRTELEMSMAVQTEARRSADPVLSGSLAETDPEVHAAISAELARQESTLEMIASENFAPLAVMAAQGSVLTNKYAEGYPGRRYYGGCEHVDVVEQLAIDRLKALFGAEYANVQPHSGAQANAAAMAALLQPGDTILGLDLAHGGHLTHGMRLNFSGQLYRAAAYHVREDDHLVDMAEVERLAREQRPRGDHRRVVGLPAPPGLRGVPPDRRRRRRLPDGGHGALRRAGRRGAAPVAAAARARGHLDHPQDARWTARRGHPDGERRARPGEEVQLDGVPRPAGRPPRARDRGEGGGVQARRRAGAFRDRQERTLRAPGSWPTACSPTTPGRRGSAWSAVVPTSTWCWSTCGPRSWTGSRRRIACTGSGITVNRNAVPFDPRPPMISSGVRIGTPALAARGFGEAEFTEVADIVAAALRPSTDEAALDALRDRATSLAAALPSTRA